MKLQIGMLSTQLCTNLIVFQLVHNSILVSYLRKTLQPDNGSCPTKLENWKVRQLRA